MKLTELTYFFPEKPVLISAEQSLFKLISNHEDWVAEFKYNGSRLQLHCLPDGSFQFWDRHGGQLAYTPDDGMLELLNQWRKKLPDGYAIFDGELRHNKTIGVRHRIKLYDVFVIGGEFLADKTFKERRKILENTGLTDMELTLSLTKQYTTDFPTIFNDIVNVFNDDELEGLVLKDLNGKLNLKRTGGTGQKSMWMYKVRRPSGRYKF